MATMKRITFLTLVLLLSAGTALWAQSPIYLFPEYTDGSVALKNRTFVKTKLNIDTFHDKLLYMDGDQIMELADFSDVSAVYIGERTFIPQGKSLYEVVDLGHGKSLLVKWHQTKNSMGKKGAYNQLTHAASTTSIDPNYHSPSVFQRGGKEEFLTMTDNSYGFLINGKFKKFTDKRSFVKLFPDKKEALEQFFAAEEIFFNNPDDVIKAARFATAE